METTMDDKKPDPKTIAEEAVGEAIAAFGDVPTGVGFTRLVAPRRETEIGADGSRSSEPRGVIDDGGVGEGDHDADAGDSHQPPHGGIGTCPSEDLLIEHLYLLADGMPHNKQRFGDRYPHAVAGDL